MNCGIKLRVVRVARLAEVERLGEDGAPLDPAQLARSKRRATEAAGAPSKRASKLSSDVFSFIHVHRN